MGFEIQWIMFPGTRAWGKGAIYEYTDCVLKIILSGMSLISVLLFFRDSNLSFFESAGHSSSIKSKTACYRSMRPFLYLLIFILKKYTKLDYNTPEMDAPILCMLTLVSYEHAAKLRLRSQCNGAWRAFKLGNLAHEWAH